MRCVHTRILSLIRCDERSVSCAQAAAKALASLCSQCSEQFSPVYANRLPWLLQWLTNDSEVIRWSIASVLGSSVTGLPLTGATGSVEALFNTLIALAEKDGGARFIPTKHGALLSLGHVTACVTRVSTGSTLPSVVRCLRVLHASLTHVDMYVREAAASSLTTIARVNCLPLPIESVAEVCHVCACVYNV